MIAAVLPVAVHVAAHVVAVAAAASTHPVNNLLQHLLGG